MKRFIRNTVLFAILPLCLLVLSFFLADGSTDPFYLRFTTSKQRDLILGTSRAAQGLQPQTIDSILNQSGFQSRLFNYAFTLAHSPYGPVYFNAIKNKLDETTRNGVYIVAVDPWSVSSGTKDPNDSAAFEESKLCLATLKTVNGVHPNVDYLINCYPKPIFSIYIDQVKNAYRKPTTFLHRNGWLEVSVSMNAEEIKKRMEVRIQDYNSNFVPYYHFSSLRFSYLEKTISLLKEHGSVYLVRLPVDTSFKRMDHNLIPDFDTLITALANRQHVSYLNYIADCQKYSYSDGNHLYKTSGQELSRRVATAIVQSKN